MARTTQLSKEKRQPIITLRQEGQSFRKISRTLNVSSSAVVKTIKRYDEIGSHEDRPRTGGPRVTSAAEDKFIRVTSLRNRKLTAPQIRAHINASQSSSSRHISTSTVQMSAWIRPSSSWSNCCKEATTEEEQQEEETCLGQETQGMDIKPVEIYFGLMSQNFRFLVPPAMSL